jgi:hypothetical protein
VEAATMGSPPPAAADAGRGLRSSTFRFIVSTFCWIRWVHDLPPVYQTGGHGEVRPKRLRLS